MGIHGGAQAHWKKGLASERPRAEMMAGSVQVPSPQFLPRLPCPAPSTMNSTSATTHACSVLSTDTGDAMHCSPCQVKG